MSDFTYVATWQGFVFVAFVIDVFARRIVGWRVSRTATAGFVLDALEQAVHQRQPGSGLTHHSDRGSQYLSIKYTERLAEAGIGEPPPGGPRDLLVHDRPLVHRDDAFGCWRSVSEGTVRTNGVVVSAPLLDQDLRFA